MPRAFDELQASGWQRAREPACGVDGNDGVLRVGEQEHGRADNRDRGLQLAQFAQQGALLGQEGAPQLAVLAVRMSPDLQVDVLARAKRAAAAAGDPGEPGP